jgi:hypothetical protein
LAWRRRGILECYQSTENPDASTFSIGAGIWWALSGIIASFCEPEGLIPPMSKRRNAQAQN